MDDLISRQVVLKALEKFEKQCWEDMCFRPLMSDARAIIKGLPSVEPKQMTGRWEHDGGHFANRWICSQCGYKFYFEKSEAKYCPNCGAKMKDVK